MAQWMGKVGFRTAAPGGLCLSGASSRAKGCLPTKPRCRRWRRGPADPKEAWLWAYARDDTPFETTLWPAITTGQQRSATLIGAHPPIEVINMKQLK